MPNSPNTAPTNGIAPPISHPDSRISGLSAAGFFEGSPVPTFVINTDHVVTHFNNACAKTVGVNAADVVGTKNVGRIFYRGEEDGRPVMADLIVDGHDSASIGERYKNAGFRASTFVAEAYEAEGFFVGMGQKGRWLFFTAAPLRDAEGKLVGAIETLQDITQKKLAEASVLASRADLETLVTQSAIQLEEASQTLKADFLRLEKTEQELLARNAELSTLNERLSQAQEHLVQSEKLASIGQLAAGVAHEINNPIGYIFSNFGTLEKYLQDLFEMLDVYETAESECASPEVLSSLRAVKEKIELAYLKEDVPTLMRESKEGIVRVRKIVQDLKDFSHVDTSQEWVWANLEQGINSTLNIVQNEIKYKADLIKNYGDIPDVECLPSEINQIVMNLVVNAAHAIGDERGTITISTGHEGDEVWIDVADNGSGIPPQHLPRIFDPFYTTKPVGKGTGLGLSLSYGIVKKHSGIISVKSVVGEGTCFRVTLPIRQPTSEKTTGSSR